jgi:tetratricopeptide (TPR) repeat protein
MIARALAAVVAVALLGGFLNYFYRGERAARASRHFAEGNTLAAAGRNEEAIEQYRDALSISHNADHRLALGLALLKVRRWDEAVIYLKEVSRERPYSAPVHDALGEAQFQMGEYAAARDSFQKAVKIDPSDRAAADRADLSQQRLARHSP